MNVFPLSTEPRGAGQESTRSVSEKTRSDPRGRERGNTRSPAALDFFSTFPLKRKKKFFEPWVPRTGGRGARRGLLPPRWSVMSHERVIKGSPVRSAGFLCAAAAGGRMGTRSPGRRSRGQLRRYGGAAGGDAGDRRAGGRGSSGARGRGPGPTEVAVAAGGGEGNLTEGSCAVPMGTEEPPVRWPRTA